MRRRIVLLTLLSTFGWGELSLAVESEGRSGRQVVDEVCAACHAAGANGAPTIGDAAAWKPLATRGLSSLTESAVKGVRNIRPHGGSPSQWRPSAGRAQWRVGEMPARGGNAALSDAEIQRAIMYMVNRSGGSWVEPALSPEQPRPDR
jgi:cytochrome c5